MDGIFPNEIGFNDVEPLDPAVAALHADVFRYLANFLAIVLNSAFQHEREVTAAAARGFSFEAVLVGVLVQQMGVRASLALEEDIIVVIVREVPRLAFLAVNPGSSGCPALERCARCVALLP